jgi:thymidylate kinase
VREAYLKIAAAEPERVKVIDTSGAVERTHERVKQVVLEFLDARGHLSRG